MVSNDAAEDMEQPKILCIIRDMTTTFSQTSCKKLQLVYPVTTRAEDFMQDISRRTRYVFDSYELIYQAAGGESVVLNKSLTSTLQELGCLAQDARNNFILCNKQGEPVERMECTPDGDENKYDDLSLGASASPIGSTVGAGDTNFPPPSENTWQMTSYRTPVSNNDTLSSLAKNEIAKAESNYVGLVNQAMTCYLNSLLQTLYMTPEFRNALYRWEFDGEDKDTANNIPFQLQKLFLMLQTSTRHAVETTELTRSFGWDSSETWQQHDVQELCRVMFDALEHKFKNTVQSDLITRLYQGKLKDYVKCLECGRENAREDTYLDIPLPVRPFGQTTAYSSVEEALRAFVQPETLDGSNQYFCEHCNKKCDAHKGLKFMSFPYLLTIQLKRFDFDYNSMHRIKLNDKVTFPDVLNLNYLITNDNPETTALPCDDASTTDSGSALDDEVSSAGLSSQHNPVAMQCIQAPPSSIDYIDDADEGIDMNTAIGSSTGASVAALTANTSRDNSLLGGASNQDNAEPSLDQCLQKGPYVYELYSIMVHSGSANGGHYYAYIKSFSDNQWYCFNDQNVAKITKEDIKKTYGGGPVRGYYSGAYSSSTNAYMLLFRQVDKTRNTDSLKLDEFPSHIHKLLQTMQEQEERDRQQREVERNTCKIKVHCQHPIQNRMIDMWLKVHKDTSLKDATLTAYQILGLEGVVPIQLCRLVKYDDLHDSIECSIDETEDTPIGDVLGGVKTTYKSDLLLEVRAPTQVFEVYKQGGITIKVFDVDVDNNEIYGPIAVRAYLLSTVRELKESIAKAFGLPNTEMSVLIEIHYKDYRLLSCEESTLKTEDFQQGSKIFVQHRNKEDLQTPIVKSKLHRIIERHQHTIVIHVVLPKIDGSTLGRHGIPSLASYTGPPPEQVFASPGDPGASVVDLNPCHDMSGGAMDLYYANYSRSPVGDGYASNLSDKANASSDSSRNYSDFEDNVADFDEGLGEDTDYFGDKPSADPPNCAVGGYQSQSEDSSLTSDSDRTIVGDDEMKPVFPAGFATAVPFVGSCVVPSQNQADDDEEKHLLSPEDVNSGDTASKNVHNEWMVASEGDSAEDLPRYFHAIPYTDPETRDKMLRVHIDSRITVGAFRKELEPIVDVPADFLKIFRSTPMDYECSRLNESMVTYTDGTKLYVRLGRPARPDEYTVKIYQLLINEPEPTKFLLDWFVSAGMSVLEVKRDILAEIKVAYDLDISLDRCRLRKKTYRATGAVLFDEQRFGEQIPLITNHELYLEVLNGPDKLTLVSQLSVYVRRWQPSLLQLGNVEEVVVDTNTVQELKQQISNLSQIPFEFLSYAKAVNIFPSEMSVLNVEGELQWNPCADDMELSSQPLRINDDGSVIIYKDNREQPKELTKEERRKLVQDECMSMMGKPQKLGAASATSSISCSKERGLRIYTHTEDTPSPKKTLDDPPILENYICSPPKACSKFAEQDTLADMYDLPK